MGGGQRSADFKGDSGVIVLSTVFLESSSVNASSFHITRPDTSQTALVCTLLSLTHPCSVASFGRAGWAVAPLPGLPPAGFVPEWTLLSTHIHQQLQQWGQSATRQPLVPERRKKCHPPSVNSCSCSHRLPWKPHSLKNKLVGRSRCTIWDCIQIHHRRAGGIQPQRLTEVAVPVSSGWQHGGLDRCPDTGWVGSLAR